MSVLDTIKEAEAVAQQKKAEAAQQARETVAKAQEDAREKARGIRDGARREADALLAATRSRVAEEIRDTVDQSRKADAAAARSAEGNLPQAVSFIVERIEKQ